MIIRDPVARPPPNEFFELARSPSVEIIVGPNEVVFTLPKDLLGYYSPYFKACFNGSFKEGKEGVLRLPDENPEHFKILAEYIRSGDTQYHFQESNHTLQQKYGLCMDYIIFTDKYDISEAASAISSELDNCIGRANSIYKCVAEDSEREKFKAAVPLLHIENRTMEVLAKGCYDWLEMESQGYRTDFAGVITRLAFENANFAAALWRASKLGNLRK